MKAALKTADGKFQVKEVETPQVPGRGWVRARIRVAGICGTDLRHWEVPNEALAGQIMGHEMAGVVEEVGPEVTTVKEGDRVVIETVLGDGTCDWCRVQQYNLCPQLYPTRMKSISRAFAEHVIGPAEKFHKLPDHVSFEEAALLDTFAVSLHGLHLSGITINDKVAVIGAGPIGLAMVQLARLSGAEVLVTDVVDSALEVAKKMGASVVVNSKKHDAQKAVAEFTGGKGMDIVYECAGGEAMPRPCRRR